jgi:AraC-like DNA-binding protein
LQPICLIRAQYVDPVVEELRAAEFSADEVLGQAGLQPGATQEPGRVLPELGLRRMLAQGRERTGHADLGTRAGARAGRMLVDRLSAKLRMKSTTRSVVREFCRLFAGESNASVFSTVELQEGLLFQRTVPLFAPALAEDQIEGLMLVLMLEVVRLAVGRSWRPSHVYLGHASREVLGSAADLGDATIADDHDFTGIVIRSESLRLPAQTRPDSSGRVGHPAATSVRPLPVKFLPTFRCLVEAAVEAGECKLEDIARGLDLGVRTLQRQLAAEGTCFSQILEESKMVVSRRLLEAGEIPISAIAARIGYSDPAHFTRAFRRWFQVTPSGFRLAIREQDPFPAPGPGRRSTGEA